MVAILFPTGSVVDSASIVALDIWPQPNSDETDVILYLSALADTGDRYEIMTIEGEANRATVEAKRDAVAAYLWTTVEDVATIV